MIYKLKLFSFVVVVVAVICNVFVVQRISSLNITWFSFYLILLSFFFLDISVASGPVIGSLIFFVFSAFLCFIIYFCLRISAFCVVVFVSCSEIRLKFFFLSFVMKRFLQIFYYDYWLRNRVRVTCAAFAFNVDFAIVEEI